MPYGVTVGDYNNDGFEDVFITYYGQNVLYRNNGDGTFTDVTKEAGLLDAAPRFGSGCTFVDYDRDGRLDLFVSNYADFDIQIRSAGGRSKPATAKMSSADHSGCPTANTRFITTTAMARFPMSPRLRGSARSPEDTG